jgi:hypothetical protein
MFVGERSYGRSNSRTALLRSWEARLEEAENGRPFAFRPMRRRVQPIDQREAMKRTDEKAERNGSGSRPVPAAPPKVAASKSGRH